MIKIDIHDDGEHWHTAVKIFGITVYRRHDYTKNNNPRPIGFDSMAQIPGEIEDEDYWEDKTIRMKQEIKLGDKVKVLHGAYKGKTGTVVGMMALDQDYADPYYEVNMDCEVEERYKCRKSLIKPNNIIGGFVASDIEKISSHGEFKVGGKVRICSKEMIRLNGAVVTVTELFPDGLGFDFNDKHYICCYSLVEPYTEPTEQTEAEKIQNATASELRDLANHGIWVGDEIKRRIKERDEKPNVGSIKIPVEVDLKESYWDAYAADLAHDIAVQMVKSNHNNYEKIGDMAVGVAKSVVENLKKK